MNEKSGAPPCGLYYRITGMQTTNENDIVRDIRQIAMVINRRSGYERNKFIIEINAQALQAEQIKKFCTIVKNDGGVALIRDDHVTPDTPADGFILHDITKLSAARATCGEDAILGVDHISSKDQAVKALEHDADFIGFGIIDYGLPDIHLLEWWYEHGQGKPALARGQIDADNCGLLARSGAGFVDVTTYIDDHPDGIMQGTVNILHELLQADE